MSLYTGAIRKVLVPSPLGARDIEYFLQKAGDLGYKLASWNGEIYFHHGLDEWVKTPLNLDDFKVVVDTVD